jgi:hypothetical protein
MKGKHYNTIMTSFVPYKNITYLQPTSSYPIYYILPGLHTYSLLPSLPKKLITYPTFNKLIV